MFTGLPRVCVPGHPLYGRPGVLRTARECETVTAQVIARCSPEIGFRRLARCLSVAVPVVGTASRVFFVTGFRDPLRTAAPPAVAAHWSSRCSRRIGVLPRVRAPRRARAASVCPPRTVRLDDSPNASCQRTASVRLGRRQVRIRTLHPSRAVFPVRIPSRRRACSNRARTHRRLGLLDASDARGRNRPSPRPGRYHRSSARNSTAFVPDSPCVPSCQVLSSPNTAPGLRLQRTPARTVRASSSTSDRAV